MKLQKTLATILSIALAVTCGNAFGQGTSTGPHTIHQVSSGGVGKFVTIGDPFAEVQIDLDPNGQPWTKSIGDLNGLITTATPVLITENIINTGTEPWGGWQENILPPPAGFLPSIWTMDLGLSLNGNPLGHTVTGLGTQTLTFSNFSQPVMPGDFFSITKVVYLNPVLGGSSGALLRIQEYPLGIVPEPASLALLSLAGISFAFKRLR